MSCWYDEHRITVYKAGDIKIIKPARVVNYDYTQAGRLSSGSCNDADGDHVGLDGQRDPLRGHSLPSALSWYRSKSSTQAIERTLKPTLHAHTETWKARTPRSTAIYAVRLVGLLNML